MTMAADKQDKVLNFSSEREQSGTCSSSAKREKNQGKNFLNVPNKREQSQTSLDSAERSGLRPQGNVPNLRFPEFSGEWKKERLKDKCTFFSGGTPSSTNKAYYDGDIPFIRSGEIALGSTELFLSESGLNNSSAKIVEKGDLLLALYGATSGQIAISQIKGAINQAILCIRSPHDKVFLMSAWEKRVDKILQAYLQGGQGNLSAEIVKCLSFYFPSLKEQSKIGQLISFIDKRIETQIRIIEKLQSLIKGLEQTLLMPQSHWTSCFIGDVLSIGSGRDYKHLSEGDIPVYGTGGYMLSVNDFLYDGESVCIGRKGTIDKPLYLHCKFWTVDTLFYTYDFREILPRYCYYLFNTINWLKYNEASGVPSLSKDTIERIKISIPSIEEQKRVCDIIDSVDEKLSLENTFLEKMISLKQFLLSSLFV